MDARDRDTAVPTVAVSVRDGHYWAYWAHRAAGARPARPARGCRRCRRCAGGGGGAGRPGGRGRAVRAVVLLLLLLVVVVVPVAAVLPAAVAVDAAECTGPVVHTPSLGPVRGVRLHGLRRISWDTPNVTAFLGLPYAAPPVGDLRFRPPQPPAVRRPTAAAAAAAAASSSSRAAATAAVFDGTRFGKACPQLPGAVPHIPGFGNSFDIPKANQSEDCLSLNVFVADSARASAAGDARPVIVFVHGGSFIAGASSQYQYRVDEFLRERPDAVVVTLNYRLGPLGFLALPEFAGESRALNWGLLDQRAALVWVQKNIRAFGGDPARVTLWGQSAGAISVCAHLLMPGSWPLFHRVVLDSGPCSQINAYMNRAAAESRGGVFALFLGCRGTGRAACLRAASVDRLLHVFPLFNATTDLGFVWLPVADGLEIPGDSFRRLFFEGAARPSTPALVGSCAADGAIFVDWDMGPIEYTELLLRDFGLWSTEVGLQYNMFAFPPPRAANAWQQLLADSFFLCPEQDVAIVLAAGASSAVFRFLFAHTPSWTDRPEWGAYHTADLSFWFSRPPSANVTMSAAERRLSALMTNWLVNFAATGAPDKQPPGVAPGARLRVDSVPWPESRDGVLNVMRIDETPQLLRYGYRLEHCVFWDALILQICAVLPCKCDGGCVGAA